MVGKAHRTFLPLIVAAVLSLSLAARADVINATANADNSLTTFGPSISQAASAGGSYAGLATHVTAITYSGSSPAGSPMFGTTGTIVAGQASAATTISVAWRTRTLSESFGTSTIPPMHDSPGWAGLSNDVVQVSGMVQTAPTLSDGRKPTDVYALQMDYSPAELLRIYHFGATIDWTIQDMIDHQQLRVGYLSAGQNGIIGGTSGEDDMWVYASDSIVGTRGAYAVDNFRGDWNAFVTYTQEQGHGVTDANLADFLGSYGVDYSSTDPSKNVAWVVVDHNSQFAVVPEPASFSILGLLSLGLLRRKQTRLAR